MESTPSRFTLFLPKIRAGLTAAFGRFPWMLLCGLAGTLAAIISIQNATDHPVTMRCIRLMMTTVLGMPLFFSLRMLRERAEPWKKWPLELIGLPLLAAWYFALPVKPQMEWLENWPQIVWIRWWLLLGALHFFAAVSAYVRGAEGGGFWQFNRRIFLRFFLATLYSAVLTGGLELALLSADKLFDLKLDKSYAYLFFIMAGCFHPAFFLAGVPRDFAALDADGEHPRGLKAFTQFALAPLVAVYTAILYVYAVKIVLAREWPHGWVALPVLVLAGVGILAALLLHPLRERAEEKWAGWFCRWFPRAMAPLSLLLLLSVRERIATYGVTEERYLGIVAGGWILVWALIFVFKKGTGIRWIPASLAAICLISAFGPWSAGSISKHSQLRRLQRALEVRGIFDGKINLQHIEEIPALDIGSIDSEIKYLIQYHGGESLRELLGGVLKDVEWKTLTSWGGANDILVKLKIKSVPDSESITHRCGLGKSAAMPVEGFRTACVLQNLYDGKWQYSRQPAGGVFIGIDNGLLMAADSEQAKPQTVPLEAFLNALPEKDGDVPVEKMAADWNSNFRIIFTNISFRRESGGQRHLESCSLLLLEK